MDVRDESKMFMVDRRTLVVMSSWRIRKSCLLHVWIYCFR